MGTCVGLLGPNGAGKSTTMRVLTAQSIADEGEVRVLDHELPRRSKAARAEMGVVPQLDNLDTTLTVEQNLVVFSHLYRVPKAERAAAIERVLDIANLSDRRDGEGRRALGRHAPAPADRARADPSAAAGAARRADRRAGPAGAPGAVGADRPAAQRGHVDPDVDALHRGGRAPLRHRHDHARRQGGRHRLAGRARRASTQGARRSRSTGRRRGWRRPRPRWRARALPHAAPARRSRCCGSTTRGGRAPAGERRPANLEDVFVLLTGEDID